MIRVFEKGDSKAVAALWRSVFAYDAPHNQPERAIADKLATQPELFFVAVRDEKIVGTVLGGYDGHRGWIYSLAVAPEARGEGTGSALMERVEHELRALNCPKINLLILAENKGVVEFYRRHGYVIQPMISMGKVLS